MTRAAGSGGGGAGRGATGSGGGGSTGSTSREGGLGRSVVRPGPSPFDDFPPPDEGRLEKYSEAWLCLLKEALPAALAAAAESQAQAKATAAAAAAAAEAQEQRRRRLAEGPLVGGSSPDRPSSPSSGLLVDAAPPASGPTGLQHPEITTATCSFSQHQAGRGSSFGEGGSSAAGRGPDTPSLISGVSSLLTGFDRLFSEQRSEPATPQGPGPTRFRVQVPERYPGVQFRKSKNLEDRYLKYAKNGTVVRGTMETDGEWIKLGDAVFLPVKVNGVQILEAVDGEKGDGRRGKSFWFACGQGNLEEEEEVLSNLDDPN